MSESTKANKHDSIGTIHITHGNRKKYERLFGFKKTKDDKREPEESFNPTIKITKIHSTNESDPPAELPTENENGEPVEYAVPVTGTFSVKITISGLPKTNQPQDNVFFRWSIAPNQPGPGMIEVTLGTPFYGTGTQEETITVQVWSGEDNKIFAVDLVQLSDSTVLASKSGYVLKKQS